MLSILRLILNFSKPNIWYLTKIKILFKKNSGEFFIKKNLFSNKFVLNFFFKPKLSYIFEKI